mmetsp:Transcript_5768/g.6278  ORF Transcript_5768/g.6278 Transcript_5768/m.6278 type:complete len:89 (-) Transcript_5768:1014-1280(-)
MEQRDEAVMNAIVPAMDLLSLKNHLFELPNRLPIISAIPSPFTQYIEIETKQSRVFDSVIHSRREQKLMNINLPQPWLKEPSFLLSHL